MTSDDASPGTGVVASAEWRGQHWAAVERYAVPAVRDTEMRLAAHWEHVSDSYLAGRMTRPFIAITAPSSGPLYGQYCGTGPFGERGTIKIRPSLLDGTHPKLEGAPAEGCWRFSADVLMHEMLHQYCAEIVGTFEAPYHGHGPKFAKLCNMIGAKLGLPPVVARNRNGSKHPVAANWPHNVRPADYYGIPETRPEPAPEHTESALCPTCGKPGYDAASVPVAGDS